MRKTIEKFDLWDEKFRKILAENPEMRNTVQRIISKSWREVVILDEKVSKIYDKALLLGNKQEPLKATSSITGNGESKKVNGDAAGSLPVQGENRDRSDDETTQPKKKKYRKKKEELNASVAILVETSSSTPVQKTETPKVAKSTKKSNKKATDKVVPAFKGSDAEAPVSSKKEGKTPVKPSLSANKESESEANSYRTPTKKAPEVVNTENGNFIYIYRVREDCR